MALKAPSGVTPTRCAIPWSSALLCASRAMDEQCRRLGLPPSQKPSAWLTYYNGGDIGLEPAPW